LKNIILLLLFLFSFSNADVTTQYPSQTIINSKIPIVDIRTPQEWRETGLIQGAIPIMFFNQRGKYNIKAFLQELNSKVDTAKPFALICRTGSRTKMVAAFLAEELHYKVTDLTGGMMFAKANKLPILPYN